MEIKSRHALHQIGHQGVEGSPGTSYCTVQCGTDQQSDNSDASHRYVLISSWQEQQDRIPQPKLEKEKNAFRTDTLGKEISHLHATHFSWVAKNPVAGITYAKQHETKAAIDCRALQPKHAAWNRTLHRVNIDRWDSVVAR